MNNIGVTSFIAILNYDLSSAVFDIFEAYLSILLETPMVFGPKHWYKENFSYKSKEKVCHGEKEKNVTYLRDNLKTRQDMIHKPRSSKATGQFS